MQFLRQKIIGSLQIKKMMAGNLAVVNDIKSAPNKISIPCRSMDHGQEIIDQIKNAAPGDLINIGSLKR